MTLPLLTGLPAEVINAIVNSIYGAVFADAEDCESSSLIDRSLEEFTSDVLFFWTKRPYDQYLEARFSHFDVQTSCACGQYLD